MTNITGAQIWDKLMQDSKFAAQPESVRNATKPFIEALPDILSDMLDKPVTFRRLYLARIKFLHYCFEHDLVRTAIDAMPKESFVIFNRTHASRLMEGQLITALKMAEEIVKHVKSYLRRNNTTQAQVMSSLFIGLNDEARRLYFAKKLTIGLLLLTQPSIITDTSIK